MITPFLRDWKLVTVITPTVGRAELSRAIESVQRQTYPCIQHLVVIDGAEFEVNADAVLSKYPDLDVVRLPYPTRNWGGRVYGSMPHIAKGDFICHLDDDDSLEPDHVDTLVNAIGEGPWSYCFRNILVDGMFALRDLCDSLGPLHPVWNERGQPNPTLHLGTGSALLRRDVALELSYLWAATTFGTDLYANDKQFFSSLLAKYPEGTCTYRHTMNYDVYASRLQYFLNGNKQMRAWYGDKMPWENR